MFRILMAASSDFSFIIIFIIALIIAGLFWHYKSTKQVILRTLKKTVAKPITRIQNKEYAKIIGTAKHVDQPLTAPLSGRKCIFYQLKVERKGSKHGWHTLLEETRTQDFFIATNDEMAIVKLDQPNTFRKIYLEKDHQQNSGFLNDANATLERLLKNRGHSSTNLLGFNRTLRYFEGVIELDEKIAVVGIAQWKSLREPIEGFGYSKILTLLGSKDQKLLITDLKKATLNDAY